MAKLAARTFSPLVLAGLVGCGPSVSVAVDGMGGGGSGPVGAPTCATAYSSASTGSGAACADFPGVLGLCSAEGATCPVPGACCNAVATCQQGQWRVQNASCDEACIPCGGDGPTCKHGTVCVIAFRSYGNLAQCLPAPCAGTDPYCASLACASDETTDTPETIYCWDCAG